MVCLPQLRQRVDEQFPQAVEALKSLVRIPSHAAAGPAVLERSARQVAALLQAAGVARPKVVAAGGGPAVIGQIDVAPGAPTVLLYAHHDVQPVAADWSTDPFAPVVKDGRLYGRGSADDAAGIVAHVAALAALGPELGVNVRLLIEGEEESGSPTMGRLLAEHRQVLAADVAVVADSDNLAVDRPALTTSLRGLAEVTVTLRVAGRAAHSGMWGGVYLDAPTLLARLIATLHDADGAVAVPGLDAAPRGADLLTEQAVRRSADLAAGLRLAGRGSVADRVWWGPALSVTGFDSTRVAEASNTLQPVARARLSLRVAPGGDAAAAQAALRDHLEARNDFGAELEIELGPTGQGYQADESGPAYAAAARALGEAFGAPMTPLGQGGSIPVVAELAAAFPDMAVLVTGVEDPDSRAHAGDESASLELLRRAILAEALLLAYLAP
ncbi:MAG: M20/M25/M40 family metallo-hydrolase [Bifidobacteriaceae bacterium]|jgi:acetylornithine deacetylase/succinyl-diaminopimelate desuccinylase-like protein|nr:M20/M25/M40 family metallo-hydrolase [Bifidobacteriaceae bacterium]